MTLLVDAFGDTAVYYNDVQICVISGLDKSNFDSDYRKALDAEDDVISKYRI